MKNDIYCLMVKSNYEDTCFSLYGVYDSLENLNKNLKLLGFRMDTKNNKLWRNRNSLSAIVDIYQMNDGFRAEFTHPVKSNWNNDWFE